MAVIVIAIIVDAVAGATVCIPVLIPQATRDISKMR